MAEIAGAKIPVETARKLDGTSLVPLLQSPKAPWPDRVLFTHVGRWNDGAIDTHKYCQAAVRWNQYSLVRIETCDDPNCGAECKIINGVQNGKEGYYSKINSGFNYAITQKGKWALYNLDDDIPQENDIAEKHPDIVEKLSEKYEIWWKEVYPFIK